MPLTPRHCGAVSWLLRLLALPLLAMLALPIQAEVRLPNGEWVESAEDLRVKVLGGYVVAQRTWQAERVRRGEYRWHLNPAWDDLRFDLDELDDSIQVVRRAGARFERTGDSEALYVFDKQFFIREEVDAGIRTGWRWYDRKGSWITYDVDGKITAYGDRNDIRVHFTRDAQGRLHQVLDHHQNVALTYTYNGNTTVLTDRAGRSVEYHCSNGRITHLIDVLQESRVRVPFLLHSTFLLECRSGKQVGRVYGLNANEFEPHN